MHQEDPRRWNNFSLGLLEAQNFGSCGCQVEKEVKVQGDNHKNAICALLLSNWRPLGEEDPGDADWCNPLHVNRIQKTFGASRVPPSKIFLPLFKRSIKDFC